MTASRSSFPPILCSMILNPLWQGFIWVTRIPRPSPPILRRADIFGVDLTTTPLAELVEQFFIRLTAEPGAVRAVLDKEFAQS